MPFFTNTQKIMPVFSIKKGYSQVQIKDADDVKNKIMKILNIKSRTQWGIYLRGEREPKVSQATEIQTVFSEIGITDIWE